MFKNNYYFRFLLPGLLLILGMQLPAVTDASDEIPGTLARALSMYEQEDLRGFISTLLSGSPLEGNQEMRQQIRTLEQIEAFYGAYQGFDLVHVRTLSDTTRVIYFLLNYRKGSVFGKLTAFRLGDQETITSFQFHTKAENIFPEALLVEQP